MTKTIGETFQKETEFSKRVIREISRPAHPGEFKEFPDARRIKLPGPSKLSTSLTASIQMRKSVRLYSDIPLKIEHLSTLLWASTGVREVKMGHHFRTAPSAGALYPIETYLVVNRVEGLEKGLYHYDLRNHELEFIKEGDLSDQVASAALGQAMAANAPVVFVWSAIFARMTSKYADRGFRYVYVDVGHIAQNLALAATALGMGSCQIGALYDDESNELIGVDGENESVIYMSVAGHPV